MFTVGLTQVDCKLEAPQGAFKNTRCLNDPQELISLNNTCMSPGSVRAAPIFGHLDLADHGFPSKTYPLQNMETPQWPYKDSMPVKGEQYGVEGCILRADFASGPYALYRMGTLKMKSEICIHAPRRLKSHFLAAGSLPLFGSTKVWIAVQNLIALL